jgi:hypothetical protein
MTFFGTHGGDGEVPKKRLYYVALGAPTTVALSVAAGSHAVTPASMTAITIGTVLSIANADGTAAETVTVTGTTGTTFTATFVNAHTANFLVVAPNPQYWTDNDVDIAWNGQLWKASSITPGPVNNQPTGAVASFKIGDALTTLLPILQATNGAELALAAIYEAGFLITNQSAVPDQVVEIFSGRVDRAVVPTGTEDNIEFTLMPPAQQDSAELPTRLIAGMVRVT